MTKVPPRGNRLAISWRDHGLWRQKKRLQALLGAPVDVIPPFGQPTAEHTWLGWGRKKSGLRAQRLATRHGGDFLLLEDGFLRSFGLGVNGAPALSVVADSTGIYYDATTPSDLEIMLQAGGFTAEELAQARDVLAILRREGLSKYNTGLPVPDDAFPSDEKRVLVVDQTAGDASIRYGLADEGDFVRMLSEALEGNPGATIYIKTHPDVLTGRRRGYLTNLRPAAHIRLITANWHPHDLLRHFDKVYVVTSQMGFDALILGKEVHCYGMPFYAGWGLTHDRKTCPRRIRRCTLEELIAAAYLRYARYFDPISGERTDFFTVARHIARQKEMHRFWANLDGAPWSGRVFAFGFQIWKHAQVRPFFGQATDVRFIRSVRRARKLGISPADRIAVWGLRDPSGLAELGHELGTPIVRVEDGFLRSVGLGSDFVPPMSLVFDSRGIYFDPSRESDLEHLLRNADFTEEELREARELRRFIVAHGLTKYNLPRRPLSCDIEKEAAGRKVVLVPGQVESDASILRGAGKVRTNLALLQAARTEEPDAFIIYKPHPDVLARNRDGRVHIKEALQYCDHVETQADVITCIEAADVIHTITSLTGFDALLRGKRVVCHGHPFYAGWGLTDDRFPHPRRTRQRTLDELAAVALLRYTRYMVSEIPVDALTVAKALASGTPVPSGRIVQKAKRGARLILGIAQSLLQRLLPS